MGRTRTSHVALFIVLGIILSILLVSPALPAETQLFATIDIEKAFNDYDKKKQLDTEVMTYAQQLQSKLELRQAHQLLSKAEFDQLAELKAKEKPTDADKKKIDELEALSGQRDQELQTLRQKTTPTDQEKTRLTALQGQITQTDTELKDASKQSDTEFQKRRFDLSKQVMDDVQAMVATVAKQKGFTMVFNKSVGETILVVYSANDITDEVLSKLNVKKK